MAYIYDKDYISGCCAKLYRQFTDRYQDTRTQWHTPARIFQEPAVPSFVNLYVGGPRNATIAKMRRYQKDQVISYTPTRWRYENELVCIHAYLIKTWNVNRNIRLCMYKKNHSESRKLYEEKFRMTKKNEMISHDQSWFHYRYCLTCWFCLQSIQIYHKLCPEAFWPGVAVLFVSMIAALTDILSWYILFFNPRMHSGLEFAVCFMAVDDRGHCSLRGHWAERCMRIMVHRCEFLCMRVVGTHIVLCVFAREKL